MPNYQIITSRIVEQLTALATPQRKASGMISHPTSQTILGVKGEDVRNILKVLKIEINEWNISEWLELANQLIDLQIIECQMMAYELFGKTPKRLAQLKQTDVLQLGRNLDNWASVDTYSCYITGVCWRNGVLSDTDIQNCLDSPNRWWRRVAVVSTVGLNQKIRGGKGDTEKTLKICQQVLNDKDDMIVKALSWSLRELSKSDKQSVIDFMQKYENELHPRVKREVWTKLTTGRKI